MNEREEKRRQRNKCLEQPSRILFNPFPHFLECVLLSFYIPYNQNGNNEEEENPMESLSLLFQWMQQMVNNLVTKYRMFLEEMIDSSLILFSHFSPVCIYGCVHDDV